MGDTTLDAAIEAATIAVHDLRCDPMCGESPTTMGPFRPTAEAAVRAAEPILRQADQARVAELERKVEAVRELHYELDGRCTECWEYCDCLDDEPCAHGNRPWPCPTIRALDGEEVGRGDR